MQRKRTTARGLERKRHIRPAKDFLAHRTPLRAKWKLHHDFGTSANVVLKLAERGLWDKILQACEIIVAETVAIEEATASIASGLIPAAVRRSL